MFTLVTFLISIACAIGYCICKNNRDMKDDADFWLPIGGWIATLLFIISLSYSFFGALIIDSILWMALWLGIEAYHYFADHAKSAKSTRAYSATSQPIYTSSANVVPAGTTWEEDITISDVRIVTKDIAKQYPNVESLTIAGHVMEIGDSAFRGCTTLRRVSINTGLDKIGKSAFADCSNLLSVSGAGNAREIGGWAFNGCTSLKYVELSGNEGRLQEIAEYAFLGCSSLEHIYPPKNVTIALTAFSRFPASKWVQ